jgi:uncharacterized protein (DUF983 family)
MFPPLSRTRSLYDWFAPLDGCPRCGDPYTREQGYYLLATWAFSYAGAAFVGLSLYLSLELFADLSTFHLIIAVIIPTALFGVVTARHGKSFFLAMDLFFDPAVKPVFPIETGEKNDPEAWKKSDQ